MLDREEIFTILQALHEAVQRRGLEEVVEALDEQFGYMCEYIESLEQQLEMYKDNYNNGGIR